MLLPWFKGSCALTPFCYITVVVNHQNINISPSHKIRFPQKERSNIYMIMLHVTRKQGYAPYLNVFPSFKNKRYTCSPAIEQSFSTAQKFPNKNINI
jgi:hypothetical protein